MHVNTLIEMAIQQSLRKSLRGLADQMDVSNGILSEWKKGLKPIPDERIRQLAKIAGQDPGPWLLIIKADQDGGDLGREWMKLFKKVGGLVAATVVGVIAWKLGGITGDWMLSGTLYAFAPITVTSNPLYIMRNRVRARLKVRGRLLWLIADIESPHWQPAYAPWHQQKCPNVDRPPTRRR